LLGLVLVYFHACLNQSAWDPHTQKTLEECKPENLSCWTKIELNSVENQKGDAYGSPWETCAHYRQFARYRQRNRTQAGAARRQDSDPLLHAGGRRQRNPREGTGMRR